MRIERLKKFLETDSMPTMTALDNAIESLSEHDRRYHPNGYHEGDVCGKRKGGDKADRLALKKNGFGGLSKRQAETAEFIMKKTGLVSRKAAMMSREIDKFSTSKERKLALFWYLKGSVILPEDAYKVTDAVGYAERAKVDPFKYDSPMSLISSLSDYKPKEKPISVEELKKNPLMSDYRNEGFGMETFRVDDSREGQELMRKVINTHWGKDKNPWCILRGDGKGNLADDAAYYWERYSALPKRVAFLNGKLQAFMATQGYDDSELAEDYEYYAEQQSEEGMPVKPFEKWVKDRKAKTKEKWWDRDDMSWDGIPIGNVKLEDDPFGRYGFCEIRNGKVRHLGAYMKGKPEDSGFIQWWKNGFKAQEGSRTADQCWKAWHENGTLDVYVDKDKFIRFSDDGVVLTVSRRKNGKNIELLRVRESDEALELSKEFGAHEIYERYRQRMMPKSK